MATVLLLLAIVSTATAQVQDSPFALAGCRVLQADGQLSSGLVVVVSQGRIERLARPDDPGLPRQIELPSEWVISPGLIDAVSRLGLQGASEQARIINPEANALAALAPREADLQRALRAGITSVMVTPDPSNLVCGSAAVFRTAVFDHRLDVLRPQGPMVFAYGDDVLRRDREPTSRSAAASMLAASLQEAKAGAGSARLALFLDGGSSGLLFCSSAVDAIAAAQLFHDHGAVPHLVSRSDEIVPTTRRLAEQFARFERSIVVGPFDFDSSPRSIRSASEYAQRGIDVVLSGNVDGDSANALRVTAALAVRMGMNASAARRGITSAAARLAGVDDQIGSIMPGMAGDVVVFSGDPLRLDSRVEHVFVQGIHVYRGT